MRTINYIAAFQEADLLNIVVQILKPYISYNIIPCRISSLGCEAYISYKNSFPQLIHATLHLMKFKVCPIPFQINLMAAIYRAG